MSQMRSLQAGCKSLTPLLKTKERNKEMKLKNHVISFELSKKLEELGVKQDSLFYWVEHFKLENETYGKMISTGSNLTGRKALNILSNYKKIYSAFTASELGEMLPAYIEGITMTQLVPKYKHETGEKMDFCLKMRKYEDGKFSYWYAEHDDGSGVQINNTSDNDDTEANARAKMLIYLLENNLLSTKNRKDTEG